MSVRLNVNEKIILINNLATLLSSGVPILEAVEVSAKYTKGNSKKVLEQLGKDLQQGTNISETLSKFPNSFSPVTINLVRAAEESGNLDQALVNIEDNLKKQKEFNGKIKTALTYPTLVGMVFLMVMTSILVFVMPRISQVFAKLKINIPASTKFLIAFSELFNNNIIWFALGAFLFVVLMFILFKYQRGIIIGILTALPGVSTLAKYIDLARFSHNMHILLKSGIPITHALELTESVVLKKEIKQTIKDARDAVSGGQKLSDGLRKSGNFPELMTLILEAGERSGKLDKAMNELAQRYEADAEGMLKTITTLLEPLLLVVIGVFIGGIMLSIIAPIYQLIGNISATAGR